MAHEPGQRFDPGRVLLPLGLGTALSLMGDATLYTVLPTHTAEAGITMTGVGVILGVNRAIRLVTNGPVGMAYDRWPRRKLFVPALFLGAFSTTIYAVGGGFWPLFAGRLLWGLAWSGIWIGGAAVVFDITSRQDRGRWTGVYQTWFFLGSSLGSLSGGMLTDLIGYSNTMWVGAALTAAGGLAALIWLPETGANRTAKAPTVAAAAPSLSLGKNRALWAAIALQGVNRFINTGIMVATLALLVQSQIQNAAVGVGVATVTGILLSSRTLLSMIAAPLCGAASDRLGSRWLIAALVTAVGLVGALLLAWGPAIGLLAGLVLTAVATGGMQSLATTLTGDLTTSQQRGQAVGLLHTAGDFASAVGPPAAYALLPFMGLPGLYTACACFMSIMLVIILRSHRAEQTAHSAKKP